jgi:holliday junction DNA helicase RuvB
MYSPKTLRQYVGQTAAVKQVRLLMAAAQVRGTSVGHILFSGISGAGKTTLAEIIAHEMGYQVVLVTPASLKSNDDIISIVENNFSSEAPVLIFVDEVHNLSKRVQEDLYLLMENRTITFHDEQPITYQIHDDVFYTIVGATTNPGKLNEPFRNRFDAVINLENYAAEQISTIIVQAAANHKMEITADAINAVTLRSRLNPRIANHLLDRCEDVALIHGKTVVDLGDCDEAFGVLGIDEQGLNGQDRRYLQALYDAKRPVGIESLIPILHTDQESVSKGIEPYLIERNLVVLTGRGRQLTQTGIRYIEGTNNGGISAIADEA